LAVLEADIVVENDASAVCSTAEREMPDLIALAMVLPEVTGVETCAGLKKNEVTRDIPVIMLMRSDSDEEIMKALFAGACDYCVFPFQDGTLASKVRRQLRIGIVDAEQKILVAEDSDVYRILVAKTLKSRGHKVIEARDGMEAWQIVQKRKDIDVIISDITMPKIDGLHLCRLVRTIPEYEFIPIIIISSIANKDNVARLLTSGADDYIIKPFATSEFLARLRSHMRARQMYRELNRANSKLKNFTQSLEKMVEFRTRELHEANMDALMMLAVASEHRDTDTGNHVRRIAEFSLHLALKMGYSETKAEQISYSSIMHDVGKIAIPDAILKKQGKLSDEEFEVMKEHTIHGEKILSGSRFFKTAREVARSHHETFIGTGYPDGLKDYDIPLAARIVAVADVYDALVSERVYKKAWPAQKACELIMSESGRHFDNQAVDAFEAIFKEGIVSGIYSKYV